ncbi:MAG: Rieske 2Fe-2S domain-containing protein [Chloroflexi bacterium]|nr:Rieske 2Fe-2S domain-containing protein [Chloroflexota bacterium]
MLTKEDNELVTRVGPGTPMGNMFRQYWLPAMMSSELPAPDCDPVRIMLLGEKLIAFRDTSGRVGLIQNHCPHRGASLFFGRNEEDGLRCVYHGWKFDVNGQCVDVPNEPAESNFKNKVKATAYPTQEYGGLVWAYLGPRATPPPLPKLEACEAPGAEFSVRAVQRECNWLQALEGDIDTSHFTFLHYGGWEPKDAKEGTFWHYAFVDRAPKYSVIDTEAGAMYGGYRDAMPGFEYWRIAQFLFPCFTMAPGGVLGLATSIRSWTPIDDSHSIIYSVSPRLGWVNEPSQRPRVSGDDGLIPNTSDWYGRFRYRATARNDYEIDRDAQRQNHGYSGYTGIKGVNLQDQAITESMGDVYDRTNERLGTSDTMIIRVRRRLIAAAKALRDYGITPPAVDNPEAYLQRAGGVFVPKGTDWLDYTSGLREPYSQHPELDATVEGRI